MPASTRLALFPLDVVLFPGVPLPLHIFEPRYRQMLAETMAGDRRFGLVPSDPRGRPPTGVIGCSGFVADVQTLPDGRSNIVLTGERRFVLRRYLVEERPYDIGLVDEFGDEPGTEPTADEVDALRQLYLRHVELLGVVDAAAPASRASDDPEMLSFQAAATLHTDPIKRKLLETRSTVDRIQTLLEVLPALIASAEAAAVAQLRSQSNGRGTHGPDFLA